MQATENKAFLHWKWIFFATELEGSPRSSNRWERAFQNRLFTSRVRIQPLVFSKTATPFFSTIQSGPTDVNWTSSDAVTENIQKEAAKSSQQKIYAGHWISYMKMLSSSSTEICSEKPASPIVYDPGLDFSRYSFLFLFLLLFMN